MAGAYRYDWGARFVDRVPPPLDPVALGTFTARDASVDARVFRGGIVTDDDYTLPYRLWMPPSPRAAVLLLHGACDYAGAFEGIFPFFANQQYAVMAYDHRGFGQTSVRGKWAGSRRMASDIGEASDFLARRVPNVPVFVVGESMGAALAIHAAAQGQLFGVSGLVLVAPGALGSSIRRIAYALLTRALQTLGGRADVFIERVAAGDLSSDAAIRLIADPLVLRRITPAILGGLVRLGQRAFDGAQKVTIPTLTLIGTREDVSALACIRGLHHRFPGDATLLEFEGGPHMLLHWKERDAVLRSIVDWIEKINAPVQQEQREAIAAA